MKLFVYLIFLVLLLFSPVIFRGAILFPGSYLSAWYEPWRSLTGTISHLGIAHKPVADDVFRQLYPFKQLAVEQLLKGRPPLWNPYSGAGQPLLAAMHPGFLNPFSFLLASFPDGLGWTFYAALQIPLLLVAMYLLGRELGLSKFSAGVSAVILALSGFVIARLIYGEYVYGLAYFIFALLFWEKWKKSKLVIYPLTIALLVALIFLSGQPQMTLYLLIYFLAYVLLTGKGAIVKPLFWILILGSGLAAVQLVPTFELYRQSNLTTASSQFIFSRFLLPLSHFLTVVIPNYFGNQGTYNWWGKGDYSETVAAVGSLPVLLAVTGLVLRKKQDKFSLGFLLGSIFAALILSLDWFGTRLFYRLPLPLVSTGIPTRILWILPFALALLAGYGMDRYLLASQAITKVRKTWAMILGFWLLVILWTVFAWKIKLTCPSAEVASCRMVALRTTLLETAVLTFGIVLLVFGKIARRETIKRVLKWFLLGLLTAAGIYNAFKFLPFSPRDTFYPSTPLIGVFRQEAGLARVFGVGEGAIATDLATQARYFSPEYYDPLYLKRYGEFIAYANTGVYPPRLSRSDVEIVREPVLLSSDVQRRERVLDLLGVGLIYGKTSDLAQIKGEFFWQDENWLVRRRLTALPRVYTVNSVEVIKEDEPILARLFSPEFNPATTVILEKTIPQLPPTTSSVQDQVRILDYQNSQVIIMVDLPESKILVLTDNYYPGWQATIDGLPTKIYRANYSFRAISLPAGRHQVLFFYRPQSFIYGLCLSLLVLIIWGIGIGVAFKNWSSR